MGGGKPYDYEVEWIKFSAAGAKITAALRFYGLPADGYMDIDLTVNGFGNSSVYPTGFEGQVQNVTSAWQKYRTILYAEKNNKRLVFEVGNSSYLINKINPSFPYDVVYQNIRYHIKPNEDGTPTKWFQIGGGLPMIFRSMKIYDLNNNLVFDAVPVSVNGIGQLYDRVSGKLGDNIGNANFIAGPEVS
jgi:hypothetical protein